MSPGYTPYLVGWRIGHIKSSNDASFGVVIYTRQRKEQGRHRVLGLLLGKAKFSKGKGRRESRKAQIQRFRALRTVGRSFLKDTCRWVDTLRKFPSICARGRAEMVWRKGVMDGCANTMGGVNYTDEQVDTVREIKGKKDYYIILGVGKDSSVKEIRKAYRKLCLKVHPDKNKAPGADEAFKLLSNAFQCLSDDEMRRKYDETGPGHELHRWSYGDGCGCDDGSFYYGRRRSGAEGGFNFLVLLQILPMFILFLVSYLPYSEPNYALQQTVVYQFGKITKAHGVSFYVKLADFDREYPPESSARLGLEIQVERDYKIDLERYCHIELQRCQWGLAFETPHCDKLKRFEAA